MPLRSYDGEQPNKEMVPHHILSQLERDPIANIDQATAAQLWALRTEPALYPRSGLLPKMILSVPCAHRRYVGQSQSCMV